MLNNHTYLAKTVRKIGDTGSFYTDITEL